MTEFLILKGMKGPLLPTRKDKEKLDHLDEYLS
jgi:hypothetical protein